MDDLRGSTPGPLARAYVEQLDRLVAIIGQAHRREWSALASEWPAFVADFHDRCVFEETVLFPAFAQHGRAARALVKRLVEEHAAMRQLVVETGEQIERRAMRAVTQELLVELLREHALVESTELDPWIALDGRDWSLQLQRVPTTPIEPTR